ncbi:MAG TPA: thiamine-phosphate kinase [Polyangiales bacterium]
MADEFSRIASIEALLKRSSNQVLLGIGDDCAVLAPSSLPRVWTTDAAVEDVHFSRAFMSLEQVGYRAFMAAASDVAAMGAQPVAALSALILPAALRDAELSALVRGLARAADACACPIVGGNLARGRELSLTTSVLGECAGRVITRAGAQVGDGVYVTGTLGGSALGLSSLRTGYRQAVDKYLAPRARLDVAAQLAQVASAAIDISDGTLQDLTHLCRASGVGARIEVDALPLECPEAARARGLDPVSLALEGGEDYELLFSAPVQVDWAIRIGTIVAGNDVQVVESDGSVRVTGRGFDHFAGS